jgi:hypothetical protein
MISNVSPISNEGVAPRKIGNVSPDWRVPRLAEVPPLAEISDVSPD